MSYTEFIRYMAMEPSDALNKLLPSFEQYYTINNQAEQPFCREAEFRSHNEQYFLVRQAHIADIDSNEFVYFFTTDNLDSQAVQKLSSLAWEKGLAKVRPYNGHKNSDISLIILCNSVNEDTVKTIKKTKFYKSYKFSFHGWSNFKLSVVELNNQHIYFNRFGKDYRKLLEKNILKNNS